MSSRTLAPLMLCAAHVLANTAACDELPFYIDADSAVDAAIESGPTTAPVSNSVDDSSGIEPNRDWRPLSRDSSYEGKTFDELALEWAHWNLSQNDCNNNPERDIDGSLCTLDQDNEDPVFFVAPGEFRTERTRCAVAAYRAILIPLTFFYADGLSHPLGVNTPAAGLASEALAIQKTMRDLELVVDGLPIDGLDAFSVGPLEFSHVLPRMDNRYTCSGFLNAGRTLQPIYLVGYFALLPPPSPGKHRLEFGGTYSYAGWEYVNEVRFTFSAE